MTLLLCTVGAATGAEQDGKRWKAVKVGEFTSGLAAPECVLPVQNSHELYVSNVQTDEQGYWVDDRKGYIARMPVAGEGEVRPWLTSSEGFPIHAPKGMCVCRDKLYFTDNQRLKRCDLPSGEHPEIVPHLEGQRFNDVASDGEAVWLSDSAAGRIFYVTPHGAWGEVKAPAGVNGLTCHDNRVFAVSWVLHDLYEIDPSGKDDPRPFGLADRFTNLDGIEILEDGTFLVSDFMGNRVSAVTPDRKRVYTLIELESPADIGIHRQERLLFVPQLVKDKVSVYKLNRR